MRRFRLISGQHTAVASGKLMCGREQSDSDKLTDYHLSRSIPVTGYSTYAQTGFLLCPLRFVMAALESTQFVQLHFPLSNQPFYNRKLSGLLNPAVQSLHSTPAAARESTSLRSPFPVLDIKLRRREIRQRELKVRGQATPKVNSFCALLLTTTMNQTTIFHFSRSSLGQLCVQRSQLRPRTPDLHPSASRTASSLLRRTASQPNTIMVR